MFSFEPDRLGLRLPGEQLVWEGCSDVSVNTFTFNRLSPPGAFLLLGYMYSGSGSTIKESSGETKLERLSVLIMVSALWISAIHCFPLMRSHRPTQQPARGWDSWILHDRICLRFIQASIKPTSETSLFLLVLLTNLSFKVLPTSSIIVIHNTITSLHLPRQMTDFDHSKISAGF